jgi:SprB repeat
MRSHFVLLTSLLVLLVLIASCSKTTVDKIVDCAQTDLAIALVSKTNTSGCSATDGSLRLSASGGQDAYTYSLNGGKPQPSSDFLNIGAGSYSVKVKDANGCEKSIQVEITAPNSTLDATILVVQNNQCNPPNGSATVTGAGGKAPYSYLLGIGGFSTTNVFASLKEGVYNVIVKDANDCQKSISIIVPRGNTGTSYTNDIKPIITTACSLPLCHDAAQGAKNWTTYDNVKANAGNIKARTGNGSMPTGTGPKLTQAQINLIACWVDDGALNN